MKIITTPFRTISLLALCAGLSILTPSCSDQFLTRAVPTIAGAAIGAGIGALANPNDPGKGALYGAAGGGAIGFIAGDHVARRKADFASREEYMNAVLADADQKIYQLQSENRQLAKRIQVLRSESASLASQTRTVQQARAEKQRLRMTAENDLATAIAAYEFAQDELVIHRDLYERERNSSTVAEIKKMEANIRKLTAERDAFKDAIAKLQDINNKFQF